MILFFDRSVGVTIPQALQSVTHFPDEVHWHEQHFPPDAADADWLPVVGAWGWTLIGHDFNWDRNELELAALRDYHIGAFYLWGAEESRWETLRCFAAAYDRISTVERQTPRPFLFRVHRRGGLTEVPLP